MTGLTLHQLGQLGHLDLLALAIRRGSAPSEAVALRMGGQSKEQLIALIKRQEGR